MRDNDFENYSQNNIENERISVPLRSTCHSSDEF
jgi:hypothetical protein